MKGGDFVVVDIETTAVRLRGGRVVGSFQTLVNPREPIPKFITKLTGIDDDLVKDAPTIDKVLHDFMDFVGSSVIVAHNASFDMGFLDHNARIHVGRYLENSSLCTRRLANRLLPDLPSKRLSALCEYFDITNERAHRAMGDAKATAKLLKNFLSMLADRDITDVDSVLRFSMKPRSSIL